VESILPMTAAALGRAIPVLSPTIPTPPFDRRELRASSPLAPTDQRELHDWRQDAIDTRILAVHGLGGSGKSQLVLNYVQGHREDYLTIFWVEAGQKESIEGLSSDPQAAL
jgi:hypothetical protein